MVARLFETNVPSSDSTVLDPGCGTGAFIGGVIRWCERTGRPLPKIVGVEADARLLDQARRAYGSISAVTLRHGDFLEPQPERFDFIVGNPPYVPITALSGEERARYRQRFASATGRFDLYLLFFEQASNCLGPAGRLVFVTPEKFLYVQTGKNLRAQLARRQIESIELIDEDSFEGLVTYPTITTISAGGPSARTEVTLRDGSIRQVVLPQGGVSWLPVIQGASRPSAGPTLSDVCSRISCGVATGLDSVYVADASTLSPGLAQYAYPTIAGRQIQPGKPLRTTQVMLLPYARSGRLLPEDGLGALGDYLGDASRRSRLLQRSCVAHKSWYAFHETPPLPDILRPKILCKDIAQRPTFVVDERGDIVPRHSVYYLVPDNASDLHELCDYLNSEAACEWLSAHCQRAANGFLRLQSHVLKQLPVPTRLLAIPRVA